MEPQVIAAIISGSIGAFAGISRALGNFNKKIDRKFDRIQREVDDLKNSVNSSVDITNSTGISGITYNYARLIYAKNLAGTTYSDSYESAHTALYNAIKSMRSLGTETSSKGDGKVILKEILCIGDN